MTWVLRVPPSADTVQISVSALSVCFPGLKNITFIYLFYLRVIHRMSPTILGRQNKTFTPLTRRWLIHQCSLSSRGITMPSSAHVPMCPEPSRNAIASWQRANAFAQRCPARLWSVAVRRNPNYSQVFALGNNG